MAIRFFDMFAGIGGFRSGLEAAGGFKCIGHCEIDKYANKAYTALYEPKGEIYYEDVTKIDPAGLPDIDLISINLFNILAMIAFAYCIIKIFFANIKRGGILLIQMSVGALYMFSVPRGYQDGFNQWMKQVAAICLTAFMQTTLLFLGLLTFPGNMLLGLGIMHAANEVPRIAQQFGLDSSVRVNMMSVVHATTAVNLTRSMARAAK